MQVSAPDPMLRRHTHIRLGDSLPPLRKSIQMHAETRLGIHVVALACLTKKQAVVVAAGS